MGCFPLQNRLRLTRSHWLYKQLTMYRGWSLHVISQAASLLSFEQNPPERRETRSPMEVWATPQQTSLNLGISLFKLVGKPDIIQPPEGVPHFRAVQNDVLANLNPESLLGNDCERGQFLELKVRTNLRLRKCPGKKYVQ